MGYGTLVVIVLAGLGGPGLALLGRRMVPVVIGEILAGLVVGKTALDIVHAGNPTVSFLGEVGFAMLMLTVGMHLPLRDQRLRASLRSGALLAVGVGLLAPLGGLAAARISGTSHAEIYAVLMASGSAAVLLPALQETSSLGQNALIAMAQVTVADVVTILSVPIVIQPSKAADAALGSALVAAGVLLILASARLVAGRGWVHTVRHLSKERHWALDLRMALVVLFFLAWLAQESGTSVLIAGFGAGVMVAAIGGPKRLSNQVRGIADGFFVPLYFVVLGAQLDLGGLFEPSTLSLAASLFALNVLIHVTVAAVARRPIATGLAASAQLGVPAAIASLGLSEGVLSAADATAIVVAALASLGACAVGVQMLVQREDQATPRPGAAAAQGMAPTST